MKKLTNHSSIFTIILLLLLIAPDTSLAWGIIEGFVRNDSGDPISGALVETDLASIVSETDGSYMMAHTDGTFNVTASASGYDSQTQQILVENGVTKTLNFSLSLSPPDIESVTPSLGEIGSNLDVTIIGTGFDNNTRVSMYLDTGSKEKIIGSLDTPDSAYAVAVSGNTAYVANDTSGLQVIDISNPAQPSFIDSVPTVGAAKDVTINGSIAYVAAGDLEVINIDPDSSVYNYLEIIDTVITPGGAVAVTVAGSIAYVAESWLQGGTSPGLVLINIDPDSNEYGFLEVIASVPILDEYNNLVDANGLTISGDRAYVATGHNTIIDGTRLRIINIDPDSDEYDYLEIIGSKHTTDWARDVAVIEGVAYVADNMGGLQVIDVDPNSGQFLEIIGHVKTTSKAVDITTKEKTLYMANSSDGLQVIDVDPGSENYLKVIGFVDTPDDAQGVTVVGSTAYVADTKSGLQIIDVSNPSPPTIIGSMKTPSDPNGVTVSGSFSYLTTRYGLQVVDVDHNSEKFLEIIGSVETTGSPSGVTVEGTFAYVADAWGGLQVIDISNPAQPSISGSVGTDDARYVDVIGSIAYVADGWSGLQVIDLNKLSDPQNAVIGIVDTDDAHAVTVIGSIAYVADGNSGLKLIDLNKLSDPQNAIIGTVDTDYATDVAVNGSTAYVADGTSLQIIDVDPAPGNINYLKIVGSVDKPAYKLTVTGNTVYVAGLAPAVQVIDVSDPTNPVLISSMDIQGFAADVTVIGGTAYVIDHFAGPCCPSYNGGLTLVPVPVELSPLSFVDDTQLNATLPSPLIAGNYTLRAFNNVQYDELFGAVTFTDKADLLHAKAIIAAGGGPDATGDIWEETKNYAQEAYNSLVYQGYRPENIYYMTDDATAEGRDASASWLNLQYAVTDWANDDQDTTSLVIYMVDHGEDERFQLRGSSNPTLSEYVTATEFDSWLDTLQAGFSIKILLVYDACFSGSFVDKLRELNDTRVVITSVDNDEVAYFLDLKQSFSGVFWSTLSGKAGTKGNLYNAWNLASGNMANYQTAQLDANGNGVTNEPEDLYALEQNIFKIGREWFNASFSRPIVNVVSENKILSGEPDATLSAWGIYDLDKDDIVRVWAEVTRPDFLPAPGITVTSLPLVDLTDPEVDGTYSAVFPDDAAETVPGFDVLGTYIITYYAEDSKGVYSEPKHSLVTQTTGTPVDIPDQYEDDDSPYRGSAIVINNPSPQDHSFHDNGDEDWVKFYGLSGEVYTVRAINPTIISDPMLSIYGSSDLANPLTSINATGPGQEESIIGWTCPADGFYYVRITNNSGYFGPNVRYLLKIYNPIALSLPGYVTGRITSGGVGVGGAVIRAGGGTAITLPDGSFVLYLMPGSYSLSVSCPGYQSTSFSTGVSSGGHTGLPNVDLNSVPRIINSPALFVKAYERYNFIPVVVDLDGDPCTFSISGKPGWATFDTTNGHLSGRPDADDEGKHGPITITVSDPAGASSSVVFNIQVMQGGIGSLPSIFMLLLNP